jgi:hypothetical protein
MMWTSFRTRLFSVFFAGAAVQLAPVNRARKRLVVSVSSGTIYLGGDNTVTATNGFAIPSTNLMVITAQGEVWATSSGGAISCLEEF